VNGLMSMYYNNQASIYISKKLVFHERTKYIEVDCHFIRDAVSEDQIHRGGLSFYS